MSNKSVKWIALIAAVSLAGLSTAPIKEGLQFAIISAGLFVSAAILHVFDQKSPK